MGVPGLFAYLHRQYGRVFKVGIDGLNLEAVYLDGNGLLYPIAEQSKKPERIAQILLEAVQEYADVFGCPCHLYIDGPAHMGKVRQQRLRRFMYEPVTMIQEGDELVPWSPAMFSPGTKMMEAIDAYIQANRASYPGLGIYSSYAEAGEGEHKIIRDLRAKASNARPRIGIVGKDADLLLLGMGLTPPEGYNLSLFILRHDDMTMEDAYRAKDPMFSIECAQLRQAILGTLSRNPSQSIWSFIVATFFMGNDFMPPIPEFGILREVLPIIMSLNPILADRSGIKWDAIGPFLQAYARAFDRKRGTIYAGWYQGADIGPSTSIQTFEELYYFNMASFKPNLDGLVQAWISTIQWNYLYYRDGLQGASTAWQYPAHYAPSLATLLRLIQEPRINAYIQGNKIPYPGSSPLTPTQALAGVLPIWLHDLLPKDIAMELKSRPQYYPYAFKRQPPTGDPIIPPIPHSLLAAIVEPVRQESTRGLEFYYGRWLRSQALDAQSLLAPFGQYPQRLLYELDNIVERWLLSNASISGDPFKAITTSDTMFIQEWNRAIGRSRTQQPKGEDLLIHVKMVLQQPINIQAQEPMIFDDHISYGQFEMEINPRRLRILVDMANDPEPVLKMAMNYASLRPRGQHWGLPLDQYIDYVRQGLEIEGFASPLNSQTLVAKGVLGLPLQGIPHFCSLFPETDAIFGSLGNFFDQEIANTFTTINPPFILDLMDRAVDKALDALQRSTKCKFILYLPTWTDTRFYQSLDNMVKNCPRDMTCSRQDLIAGQYDIEDIMAAKSMKGMFNSNIWIISKDTSIPHA